jgi:hypothetical protein
LTSLEEREKINYFIVTFKNNFIPFNDEKLGAKKSAKNLREKIKICGQFHQHFTSAFAPIFLRQKKLKPIM